MVFPPQPSDSLILVSWPCPEGHFPIFFAFQAHLVGLDVLGDGGPHGLAGADVEAAAVHGAFDGVALLNSLAQAAEGKPLQRRRNLSMIAMDLKAI